MKRRILSLLLAVSIMLTSMDISVFATELEYVEGLVEEETDSGKVLDDLYYVNERKEQDIEIREVNNTEELEKDISVGTEIEEVTEGIELSEVLEQSAVTEIISGKCGDNLTWTLDNGVLTISGTGEMYDYYRVNRPWYNYIDNIVELRIEDGITYIGTCAFSDCKNIVSEVVIPSTVERIGKSAFGDCSGLTGDLIISNSVTSIGQYAFSGCSGLTGDLIIPDSVTSLGEGAFSRCSGLTGNLIISDNITSIERGTFSSCSGLTGDLIIPDSVTSIGESAFWYCSGLTGDLIISNSVTSIGQYAFLGCSGLIGDLVIPNSVVSIGERAFSDCSGLTGDLIIPNSVTSIGQYAFYSCSGLAGELRISDSITNIENSTFYNCEGLTGDLIIPDSVISIGKEAFYGCKGFTGKLKLSENLTSIGEEAFYGCEKLIGDLIIPEKVIYIGEEAFASCSGFNGKLTLSKEITMIYDSTFAFCSGLTGDLVIPDGVKNIGYRAFVNCSGLTGDLIIPDSVESVGEAAFSGCSGFNGKLKLSNQMRCIEESVFSNCTRLNGNVVIPESITSIGKGAFGHCSKLTGDLVIPQSVEVIDENAFYKCSGLTGDLVIPDSVGDIGNFAFGDCSGFNGILKISNKMEKIPENAFYRCSGLTGDLIVPDSVISIGNSAFAGCSGFKGRLEIPDSVESIGNSAFSNCSGLTGDLIIPDSVTSLGNSAFLDCSGFTGELVISNNIESIGFQAFYNCEGLTGDLIIPDSVMSLGDSAFLSCSGFTGELIISNNIESIGYQTFAGCSGLTGNLIIPEGVKSIGSVAFRDCKGFIGKLSIPEGVESIGYDAFQDCSGLSGRLVIPGSVKSIGNSAFEGCVGFIGTLQISDGVEHIGDSAFEDCKGFRGNLVIPDSVKEIGESAFRDCTGFDGELKLSNSLNNIKYRTFLNCNGLKGDIVIPNSVTIIGNSAFSGCKGFTGSIKLSNNIESIGYDAFDGCIGVKRVFFCGEVPKIGSSCFYNVKSKMYYPGWLLGWENTINKNYGGTLTWIPYEEGTNPWEMDFSENSPGVWFITKKEGLRLTYTYEEKYNIEMFDLSVETFFMDKDNGVNEYENVSIVIELSKGLSFSADSSVQTISELIGTVSSTNKSVKRSYPVYIDENYVTTEYRIKTTLSVIGYEKSQSDICEIPVEIINETPKAAIVNVVEKYTSSREVEVLNEIFNTSKSDEEIAQRLFEYYNYDNMLDVKEQITRLREMHDERWDYIGLTNDEMYLAWQYYNYLNNTSQGIAARACLYASGLVFNGEVKDWIDPSTYIDSEYPGVKKYKSLLEEFIKKQSTTIEFHTYMKETEKFINSAVGFCSNIEKGQVLKRMKEAPDIATCKSIFNNFIATKIKDDNDTLVLVSNGEKPAFIKAMKDVDDAFKIVNLSVEIAADIVDASNNMEIYEVYSKFLQEIISAKDLPAELRAAAYQLDKELKQKYWTPVQKFVDEVRNQCIGEAFDAVGFKDILNKGGYLAAVNFTAFCINQFVDIGDMVVNSCHTEGYAFLAMHYKDKLEKCKEQFLANPTEGNAWAFYEAYVMLWKLRIAGEEKFLEMNKLEGGTVVDGLSKIVTGGTISDLISDLCGYEDKETALNENIDMLKGFAFHFSIKDVTIPEEYQYLQKIVIECPVSVEIIASDGTQLCVLPDGVETEITNEYGTFISFYRATTGDYAKIAYLRSNDAYTVKAIGQDLGEVTCSIAKTEDHQTYTVNGFEDVIISENGIIHLMTDEDVYEIDKEGDGTPDVKGELADKKKIFVQFDYQNGEQIEIRYAGENGKVIMPIKPVRKGYEFKGWYTDFDIWENEFIVDTVVEDSITVYAKWESLENADKESEVLPEDIPEDGVIPAGIWIAGIVDKTYSGGSVTQFFRVYDSNKLLKEGKDYTVSYKNNKNAYVYDDADYVTFKEKLEETGKKVCVGTFNPAKAPQLIVKMKGNYSGSKTFYFKIEPANILTEEFSAANLIVTYTGKKQTPTPILTWNGKKLKYPTDFYIPEYDNAKKDKKAFTESGVYSLTVTGKKNFVGEIPITFTISESAKQITMNKVSVKGIKNLLWNGEQLIQTDYRVSYKNDVLSEENGDYTISWGSNTDIGTGTVTFTGTGLDTDGDGYSYIGKKTVSFKITGFAMSKVVVMGVDRSYTYTGKEITPTATLTFKADKDAEPVVLVENVHYVTEYSKNLNKGTATIIFTGLEKGGYTGTKRYTFKIISKGISDLKDGENIIEQVKVSFTDSIQENNHIAPYMKGGAKPEIIVTCGDMVLENGKDYTIRYSNNKKVALSTDKKAPMLTIKGKGNFTGTKNVKFSIWEKALSSDNGITVVVKDKVASTKKNGYRQSFIIYDADGKTLGKNDYDAQNVIYTLIQTTDENGITCTVNEVLDKNSIVPANSIIQITIEGKGYYEGGSVTGSYRILESGYDISKATIQINNHTYTGEPILINDQSQFMPNKVYMKIGKEKRVLILGEDIEVVPGTYVNNVNKGTAKVTFRGINDFGGTKTVSYKIGTRSLSKFFMGIYSRVVNVFGMIE